jgi:hypothetical protein
LGFPPMPTPTSLKLSLPFPKQSPN